MHQVSPNQLVQAEVEVEGASETEPTGTVWIVGECVEFHADTQMVDVLEVCAWHHLWGRSDMCRGEISQFPLSACTTDIPPERLEQVREGLSDAQVRASKLARDAAPGA